MPAPTDRTNATQTQVSAGGPNETTGFGPPVVPGEVGTLGPYRIVKELGKGGMGAVYAALDTRLERRLALKVMLPEFATDTNARERFLREARAAAKVGHDNVVTVYEADERNGVAYIAMQFLDGSPLDQYLKQKGLPTTAQALRIGMETAAGLEAAHKLGLVHRDIKPANLWLEAPNGRVKVLDFGLARPVDTASEVTKSGAVVGTPAYMSPEQARGEKVDHRTDLFSLGAVLYRLCTGKLPFTGPTTMAVLMALGTQEPVPVRELNPEVPEPLAALVHQLLAKKAEARPQSAAEVVKRLRTIAANIAAPRALPADQSTSYPQQVQPQVVYVPIQVTAVPPAHSPFADLDEPATEATAPLADPAPKPKPARTQSRAGSPWLLAGGALLFAAFAVAGTVFVFKNKDGAGANRDNPDGVVKPSPVGPKLPPPAAPDRKAAEWVLSVGGTVRVNGDREIKSAADLPKERFTLTGVVLNNTKATDDDMAQLKGLKNLSSVLLHVTSISDAGLAHLKDCPDLAFLMLHGSQATSAGLLHLKGLTKLNHVDLRGQKTTAKELAEFHDAVPGCRIDHDGGTIEPVPDLDRKAAEYVVSVGGTVKVNGGVQDIRNSADLPKERFTLSFVNLSQNEAVTDVGLASFKGCKGLTILGLNTSPKVTDAGLVYFTDCKNLTELNLDDLAVTDAGLANFKDCKKLTHLYISRTGLTNAGLTNFKDLPDLTVLALSLTKVTDDGLAQFGGCKNLTVLQLWLTAVTDAGLAHFKGCKKLATLNLRETEVTDAGLAHLKELTNLTSLDVRKTKVTAVGLKAFHTAVPGCRIEHDGGTIEPIDAERTAAEWVLAQGGSVHLNGAVKPIKEVTELPKGLFTLRAANLTGTMLTDTQLVIFKQLNGLQQLSLGRTQVTDVGLVHIKEIKSLTNLSAHSTQVTDAGLAHLKELKGLTILDLGTTTVSDAGVEHLKELKSLKQLSLASTQVTDAGLLRLKEFNGLTDLNLFGTSVSDTGLTLLKEVKSLTRLDVRKTKVTAKGVADLAAALPSCRIEYDGGVIEPKK